MRAPVGFLRLALALLPALGLLPLALVTRVVGRFAPGPGLRWGARVQRWWALGTRLALGVRLTLEGPPGGAPPPGAYLIAANHVSYLDILALGSVADVRFVAKSEIAGWPAVGILSRSVGTIFLRQSQPRDVVRVGREIQRTLAAGVSVVVFPEGAASAGEEVAPFHGSLFGPAARAGLSCLPVALGYRTPGVPWTPRITVAWWGGMPLFGHLARLVRLGELQSHVRFSAPVSGVDRKALALAAEQAVRAAFRPLAAGPPPPSGPRPIFGPGTKIGGEQMTARTPPGP